MNNDLISRSELKKAFKIEELYWGKRIIDLIDNAPTVEAYTKEDMRKEYQRGITDAYRDNPPI